MLSEEDAADELESLNGEIAVVRASIANGHASLRTDLARLEARRGELTSILDGYAAARAVQSDRDRLAHLREHVGAYNALVHRLNSEIVEIRANLPPTTPGDGYEALRAIRPLSEIELPPGPSESRPA
ncbi:MAG: hypothetical protein HYR85_24960 [Planctomycetes bacterium]|nr:hypothetical protein [Planctomycetota bacterium]MBI3844065.1 hypothetical protein [Planctomycetota bacterium]